VTAGELLLAALKLAGMYQSQLARATGLSTKHINQLVTGKAPFSVAVALRIESALQTVSAEDLMVAQARAQVRQARATR
jgi:HTH-type transcriptional regulator/antitoxin HigA